jgi:hypothetical protein
MAQQVFIAICQLAEIHARLRDLEEIIDSFHEDLLNNLRVSRQIQIDRFVALFSILSDVRQNLMLQYAKADACLSD